MGQGNGPSGEVMLAGERGSGSEPREQKRWNYCGYLIFRGCGDRSVVEDEDVGCD